MDFHPIAAIFPMLGGPDQKRLVESIRENGLRVPIVLYEGKVLDGRNRARACEELGIAPKTTEFKGTALDAIKAVWDLNLQRRHLNSSQRAIADAKRNKLADVYGPVKEDAAARKGQAAGKPRGKKQKPSHVEQIPQETVEDRKTRTIRAQAAETNPKYIDLADKLVEEQPELAEQVETGKKTLTQVARELRRQELAAHTPEPPKGKYRVLYADPPWKYNDALAISKDGTGESYGPADAHYPSMSISELCALPIADLAEDNAVLFLWTTAPLLEDAFRVVKAWGFRYVTNFVWWKMAHNMGHYCSAQHEHLLLGTRGSCLPDNPKLYPSVISVKREGHSVKPKCVIEMIDALYTHGAKIELFARSEHANWTAWGQEA